ncbi:molybdopterin-binding protein [Curtobacterium sp. MCPF17_052]|uniref:molybdopterin-binding protein n=1 Tax=Curtobacterium sp. MCPF17_052 TaxID=2175655 RepID=UPI0034641032
MTDAAVDQGRAAVLVVSTSAATDPALDHTGPVIAEWLRTRGFTVGDPAIVPDGGPVADTLTAAVSGGARVVITTGGTGVTPTDRTPEAVAPLLDLELPRHRRGDPAPRSRRSRPHRTAQPRSRRGRQRPGLRRHAARVPRRGHRRAGRSRRTPRPPARPAARRRARPAERLMSATAAERVVVADVVDRDITVDEVSAVVASDHDGAVVTFAGVVRDHDGGKGGHRSRLRAAPERR